MPEKTALEVWRGNKKKAEIPPPKIAKKKDKKHNLLDIKISLGGRIPVPLKVGEFKDPSTPSEAPIPPPSMYRPEAKWVDPDDRIFKAIQENVQAGKPGVGGLEAMDIIQAPFRGLRRGVAQGVEKATGLEIPVDETGEFNVSSDYLSPTGNLVLDAATDPLNYLAGGIGLLRKAPKLGALLKSARTSMSGAGIGSLDDLIRSPYLKHALADERGGILPTYFGELAEGETFYSKLGRVLEAKLQGSGKAPQLSESITTLAKKEGVRVQEELKWSGLTEWLAETEQQGHKLSKDEVLQYLAANRLQVTVTELPGSTIGKIHDPRQTFWGDSPSYRLSWPKPLRTNTDRASRAASGEAARENYREVILTLPEDAFPSPYQNVGHYEGVKNPIVTLRTSDRYAPNPAGGKDLKKLLVEEVQGDLHQAIAKEGTRTPEQAVNLENHQAALRSTETDLQALEKTAGMKSEDAYERYVELRRMVYDLAELPSNELPLITTPRRGRLMEELGIKTEQELKTQSDAAETLYNDLYSSEELVREARGNLTRLESRLEHIPYPAPFGKTWAELGMKRILKMAADEGYDAVSWTTGAQQLERYSGGTEVVRTVRWQKPPPGLSQEEAIAQGWREADKLNPDGSIKSRGLDLFKMDFNSGSEPGTAVINPRSTYQYTRWDRPVAVKKLRTVLGPRLTKQITEGGETGFATSAKPFRVSTEHSSARGTYPMDRVKFFYDDELRNNMNKLLKKYKSKVEGGSLGQVNPVRPITTDKETLMSWLTKERDRLKEAVDKERIALDAVDDLRGAPASEQLLHETDTALRRMQPGSGYEIQHTQVEILDRFAEAHPESVQWQIKGGRRGTGDAPTEVRATPFTSKEKAIEGASPQAWTIKLSPEMRTRISKEGFPLHEILLGTTAGGAAGTAAAAKKQQ